MSRRLATVISSWTDIEPVSKRIYCLEYADHHVGLAKERFKGSNWIMDGWSFEDRQGERCRVSAVSCDCLDGRLAVDRNFVNNYCGHWYTKYFVE